MTVHDDPAAPVARNPRREAQDLVGAGYDARVLEPSPPAVGDGPWFADDPATVEPADRRPLVAPVPGPELTWAEWLDDHPEHRPWAAAFLGDWYGFAWSVLEELRADPACTDASRVQLWPEHFDAAFECLPAARRVTVGASPGDAAVPEPYLYVLPGNLQAASPDPFWNATSFRGAILRLGELLDAADQRAAAGAFLRRGLALLER